MRYYVDCEFDGHNGPLLSFGIVREDGLGAHYETGVRAMDIWVIKNVEPLMDKHKADVSEVLPGCRHMGAALRNFIGPDQELVIVADSPVDIERFCNAYMTGIDGSYWPNSRPLMRFEVHDIDAYPTSLEGAVQHNAWWDAMALREKLTSPQSSQGK